MRKAITERGKQRIQNNHAWVYRVNYIVAALDQANDYLCAPILPNRSGEKPKYVFPIRYDSMD